MLHENARAELVCSSNASRIFSARLILTNNALLEGSDAQRIRKFATSFRPQFHWSNSLPNLIVESSPDARGFFSDELEQRFVIERGLLRFGEPGFTERLQAREIV